MRDGIFFNHFGVTYGLEIFETGFVGIFGCLVDNVYESFFEAPDDSQLVDLICFAIESWRDEFACVEGVGWSAANGDVGLL